MLCTTTETGLLAKEPQLMALVKGMADGPSTVQQERIKQEIGALLQEKGIPPEEVKAFLENLTVAQAKDLLKVSQGAWVNGPAPEGSANVAQVRVESEKQRAPTADPQNVVDILSKDSADQKDPAAKKAAFASSYSGANPAGGIGAETESNATTAKKSDQNSPAAGNVSVLETPAQTSGETLTAAAKPGMIGFSGEVPSAAASKSAPQPPVESSLRAPVVLPEPLPKILDRMVWMVQGGIQRTTVELSPPELGKIQLSLVIENGQIRAVLGTESLAVKELIDANLNQLSSQLESLGFSVQSFQVMVGLNQHERPDQGSAWQWESPSDGGDPPEEEPGVGTEASGGGYNGYSGDGQHISVRV
jgi:flagellar hook-length control protein FliK